MSRKGKILSMLSITFITITLVLVTVVNKGNSAVVLDTIYGRFEVRDPLIAELLYSDSMQRLKKVHQYGVVPFATPTEQYSRYDHSVGVYALLRRYGLSQSEQIAGLLHDTSHTAFSHVADYVFKSHNLGDSYQDDIHEWYLRHSDVAPLLETYGYSIETVHFKRPDFKALEQDRPTLCADRIDYNLQGGLRRGLISEAEAQQILNDLKFEYPNWYFTNAQSAKKLARIALNMSENLWGAAWQVIIYQWAADALNHAISLGILSLDDFHFSTDDYIWDTLVGAKDPFIDEMIHKITTYEKQISTTSITFSNCDAVVKGKFLGIDPFVKVGRDLKRLSQVDSQFADEFTSLQSTMAKGWPVKFNNHEEKLSHIFKERHKVKG